jgi:colanic acid biosynthesis glycosyl transferase WcaI
VSIFLRNTRVQLPRRVWIISELYYPEETSTGYILTKIAEGLTSQFAVNVLCGQPSYSARGVRAPQTEDRNGVHIQRCPATTLNKDVLLFRLANLATISLSIFMHAVWLIQESDVVLVVTNPPLLPFLIALVCRLRGSQFLLLVHDAYPEILIVTELVKSDSLFSRLGAWLNQWLYRSAARVIVLGRDMQALAMRRLEPLLHHRVVVISNWADLDQITPLPRPRNELLKELGLGQEFIVEYAGNMGRPNDLESILESARQLRDRVPVRFLLIGSGAKLSWVKRTIGVHNLTNVTLLPSRPRSDQENFLNACDVSIISLVKGMTGISVPSRLYNIMAAGKPIIAMTSKDSEVGLVVEEEGIGWVIPPGQPDRIIQAIESARSCPQLLLEMGKRARAAAESKYSFQHVIGAYRELISGLDDGPEH